MSTILQSLAASLVRAAAWLQAKVMPIGEVQVVDSLKKEVQASTRDLAGFDFEESTDAHSLSKNIEDYVMLTTRHIHLVGSLEGTLNVNLDGLDARLRTYAYALCNIVGHHCRLLAVKTEAEIQELDTKSSGLDSERAIHEQHLKELQEDNRQYPASFSKPMGWVYTGASVLLFIADFPLSFLAMQKVAPTDGSHSLFYQSVLSIGIMLVPLIVKLYMDKYIIPYRSQPQPEPRTVKQWLEIGLTWLILPFVVVNWVVLGYARHYFIESSGIVGDVDEEPSIESVSPPHFNQLDSPETIQFLALLFLSILFPLLSGILLAYGLFYLKNSRSLKHTQARIIALNNQLTTLAKSRKRKMGEREIIAGRIAQWTETGDGSLTQLYHQNFVEAYKRGFVLHNGSGDSRYHIMYRKYLRHFSIAQFAGTVLLALASSLALGSCIRDNVETNTDNRSLSSPRLSAEVVVLCDFTTNARCMDLQNRSLDTLPRVLRESEKVLNYCFRARQPNNRVTFYAVQQADGAEQLARFAYPSFQGPVMNKKLQEVRAKMKKQYEQLEKNSAQYLRQSEKAKNTCLINSILRLHADIQEQAALATGKMSSNKILLLSDRLEVCNGVKLENKASASEAIAAFDHTYHDLPNFQRLGVEFVFVAVGCNQYQAANDFWTHVLGKFGYSPTEAKRMSQARQEVPRTLFPTATNL
jgi:hypothetical protein